MARKTSFVHDVGKPVVRKSLRHNARDAAEYLTGRPYKQPESPSFRVYTKPGRGASGESSN